LNDKTEIYEKRSKKPAPIKIGTARKKENSVAALGLRPK
jgi:hypothetical protein